VTDPISPPGVVHGQPGSAVALAHCAATLTVSFLAVPPREVFVRWRRTGPYLGLYAEIVTVLLLVGIPWPWAIAAGTVVLVVLFAAASAFVIQRRITDSWYLRSGIDCALILAQRHRRTGRLELHSWSAWRKHRGLGRQVAAAALRDAPRPVWIQAATPDLRQLYADAGAKPDPGGSRWMVVE